MNTRTKTEPTRPEDWVGRSETRDGRLTMEIAGMLAVSTGHHAAPPPDFAPGAPMPPLWHWAAFPEFAPMSALGEDGHPRTGGFLPPVPLPRRMWAGGALSFEGALHIGERLGRRSEILSVEEKTGGAGPMVFVSVRHEISGAKGRVEERQDIVYLQIPEEFRLPKPIPAPEEADWEESLDVGPARLFRFSAATFNSHRIHYDHPYAREVEKYPGLVVHGPLQAILLIEAGARHAGAAPVAFRFRGVSPMFHDHPLRLVGAREPDAPAMTLCTVAEGRQGMQARLEWAQ